MKKEEVVSKVRELLKEPITLSKGELYGFCAALTGVSVICIRYLGTTYARNVYVNGIRDGGNAVLGYARAEFNCNACNDIRTELGIRVFPEKRYEKIVRL